MHLVVDDAVNRSIWAESVGLQKVISGRETIPLRAGAQQAMPKACDQNLFSAKDPLPWVPDLVGEQFGKDRRSVLVVASSYNGFIEGYSGRDAVLSLADYTVAKNAGADGLGTFITKFKKHVVDRDRDYYQPILRDLLPPAGCDPDFCCITDLCKASFVQRGSGPDRGTRGDTGSDTVVKNNWQQWIPYVTGRTGDEGDDPLPYQWLWQRMQKCHLILSLGTIAEYGVLKIFQRMATAPIVHSWMDGNVVPDHPTMTPDVSDWGYDYADSRRKMRHWLHSEDWWVLHDSSSTQRWSMLPVHHPASAIGRGSDPGYLNTVPTLQTCALASGVTPM